MEKIKQLLESIIPVLLMSALLVCCDSTVGKKNLLVKPYNMVVCLSG
jgi:hypothetical protein